MKAIGEQESGSVNKRRLGQRPFSFQETSLTISLVGETNSFLRDRFTSARLDPILFPSLLG